MAFTKFRRGIVNLLQQLELCLVSLALSAYCKKYTYKYGFLSEKNVWSVTVLAEVYGKHVEKCFSRCALNSLCRTYYTL